MPFCAPDKARVAVGAAALAIIAALALPALALAATVEVREEAGAEGRAVLEFVGGAGPDEVTFTAPGTKTAGFLEVEVTDESGLTAKSPRCSSDSAKAATCLLRRPQPGVWSTTMRILLGAGANKLEAGKFTGPETTEVETEINAGGGADEITTGDTADTIDPGDGKDLVSSGNGNDRVLATESPDAADLYVLGGGFDQVSYARRSDPVSLNGITAGAAGENDELVEVEAVVGGAGNDTLEASGTIRTLDGGPGEDTLTGSQEGDALYGGLGNDALTGNAGEDVLVGGEGDDSMSGGEGDDRLEEIVQEEEAEHLWIVGLTGAQSGGADSADGGEGNDQLELGPGNDHGEGGGGIDLIFGGAEDDELDGGFGDDGIAGEAGADRLLGGGGFDEILAGRLFEPKFVTVQPVDSWRDEVDCGPNFDVAVVNRWDSVRACEETRLVPMVELRRVRRYPRAGLARLAVRLVGPGRLSTIGKNVKPLARGVKAAAPERRTAVMVPLIPRGRARATLRRRGYLTVRFGISFQQPGGLRRTEPLAVTLVWHHRAKPKPVRK